MEEPGVCEVMTTYQKNGNLNIWWFPHDFCQSRYGAYQQSGRNSCTLISLILANKVCRLRSFFTSYETLPPNAQEVFGDAINEGNKTYHRLQGTNKLRDSLNLSIPDAISAIFSRQRDATEPFMLKEKFFTHLQADIGLRDYTEVVVKRLTKIMEIGLGLLSAFDAIDSTNGKHMIVVVIADSRTVTFIFEIPNRVVAFVDSHQHGNNWGAVIAMTTVKTISDILRWYVNMIREVYNSRPDLYEVSFLSSNPKNFASPFT